MDKKKSLQSLFNKKDKKKEKTSTLLGGGIGGGDTLTGETASFGAGNLVLKADDDGTIARVEQKRTEIDIGTTTVDSHQWSSKTEETPVEAPKEEAPAAPEEPAGPKKFVARSKKDVKPKEVGVNSIEWVSLDDLKNPKPKEVAKPQPKKTAPEPAPEPEPVSTGPKKFVARGHDNASGTVVAPPSKPLDAPPAPAAASSSSSEPTPAADAAAGPKKFVARGKDNASGTVASVVPQKPIETAAPAPTPAPAVTDEPAAEGPKKFVARSSGTGTKYVPPGKK
eukprot:PhM_4_TR4833/c0_g1_i1/m.71673